MSKIQKNFAQLVRLEAPQTVGVIYQDDKSLELMKLLADEYISLGIKCEFIKETKCKKAEERIKELKEEINGKQ